jgi:hypothetical protein
MMNMQWNGTGQPQGYQPIGQVGNYNYDGSVMVEPEFIDYPAPQGVAYLDEPVFFNGQNYYWHHGHWWREHYSHPYFQSQNFSSWYQQRFGSEYQGFDHFNNYHHHHHYGHMVW